MSSFLRLLLPYRKLELTTRLAPGQIVAALDHDARAPSWLSLVVGAPFAFDGRVLKFHGSWDDTSFDLRRVALGRRSFTPRIRGTIAPAPHGSLIRITMAPTWFSWVFAVLWTAGMGWSALFYAQRGASLLNALGEPLVILSFILLAGALTFAFEARKARTLLLTMFKTTTWHSR